MLKDGVNDEGQQPLTAVHPHLEGEERGHSHSPKALEVSTQSCSHQTQRARQQQSFTLDPPTVQQDGAQGLQPGPVAALLGRP